MIRSLLLSVSALATCAAGTRAQTLLADLHSGVYPYPTNRQVLPLASTAALALFSDVDTILWRSDGTAAGTGPVSEQIVGSLPFGVAANRFAVLASGCPERRALWRTDGSVAGTAQIGEFGPITDLLGTSMRVFMVAAAPGSTTPELWTIEADGTTIVRLGVAVGGQPLQLLAAHGRVYFHAAGQLWQTDGTAAGTRQLTTDGTITLLAATTRGVGMLERAGSTQRVRYYDVNGTLSVVSTNADQLLGGTGAYVVWAERGTGTDTRILAADGQAPPRLVSDSGRLLHSQQSTGDLYMIVSRNNRGVVLATDGGPGVVGGQFFNPVIAGTDGNRLLINELWASTEGLYAVDRSAMVLLGAAGSGTVLGQTPLGTLVRFLDGTSATLSLVGPTQLSPLRSIQFDTPLSSSIGQSTGDVPHRANRAGVALLAVFPGSFAGIWRTDGTPSGTYRLVPSQYGEIVATARRFYFSTGSRLYESDGTVAGTILLRDFAPYGVRNLTVDGDDVVAVFARNGADELLRVGPDRIVYQLPMTRSQLTIGELLRGELGIYATVTDGRVGGIERLRPNASRCEVFAQFPGSSLPVLAGSLAGNLLLGTSGLSALRESDGLETPLGAPQPMSSRLGNGLVFLTTADGLWRTDGTVAGTFRLLSNPIYSGAAVAGGRLYFSAQDAQGAEPWTSDGTVAGTRRIADLNPGPCGSSPYDFVAAGDGPHVVFVADTPDGRVQLWSSDGTSAGTRRLGRTRSLGSSYPRWPIVLGNRIVAWADDGVHGSEPWAFDATPIGAYQSQTLSGSCGQRIALLTPPRIGSAGFGFTATRTAAASVAVLGTRATTIRLPGALACELRADDLFAVLTPQTTGSTQTVAIPLPADEALIGLAVVAQFANVDLQLSDAAYVVLGR